MKCDRQLEWINNLYSLDLRGLEFLRNKLDHSINEADREDKLKLLDAAIDIKKKRLEFNERLLGDKDEKRKNRDA